MKNYQVNLGGQFHRIVKADSISEVITILLQSEGFGIRLIDGCLKGGDSSPYAIIQMK